MNTRTTVRAVVAACCLALALTSCGGASGGDRDGDQEPLLVAGAADLQYAFAEIGDLYTQQTGQQVEFTFGSSGQLAQQLENGAPFDVFASASVDYVDDVVAAGVGDADTVETYAFGRLVVWTADDVSTTPVPLTDLTQDRFTSIAIANPEHAPYGQAAQEALQAAGIYDQVQPRLVYGENVADTLRLATSGNATAAVVALSLATVTDGGTYDLVDAGLHDPLEQALVVTASGDRARGAQTFADLVGSPQGREIMTRYGFLLPGDPAPAGSTGTAPTPTD